MRCAITGAAGYVGSAITRRLQAQGWEVLGWGRRKAPLTAAHTPYDLRSDVHNLPWDGVDALVHTAYDFKTRGWEETKAINVEGSLRLLSEARKHGVARVVFISSLSAYPGCRSLYGRAKLTIEENAIQMGCAVVRPGLVHGGGVAGGMLGALEKVAAKSPVIPLIGDGSFPQYLAHADDLGDLVSALVAPGAPQIPRAIMAAHPEKVTFRQLLQTLAARHQRQPFFLPIPWQLLLAGFKTLEALRLPSPFRSDSLVGFVHQNPAPDFQLPELPQISFRPFV